MPITNNAIQTQALGAKIADKVREGGIIALYGDLGSGKTTFVQGLAKGLGIKGNIISPTFIIVRKYDLKAKSQKLKAKSFYHIDLYRIESEGDLAGIGIKEILMDDSNIIAIEWPEKIEEKLSRKAIKIKFDYIEDERRNIEVESPTRY